MPFNRQSPSIHWTWWRWQRLGNTAAKTRVCVSVHQPATRLLMQRTSGRGGGVAIVFRQHVKRSLLAVPACRTLEVICVRLTTANGPVIIMIIYRPGSEKPSVAFFKELMAVLEMLVESARDLGSQLSLPAHVTSLCRSGYCQLRQLLLRPDIWSLAGNAASWMGWVLAAQGGTIVGHRTAVELKLLCLVHQSLAGQTPTYLVSDLQLTANIGRPQLWSASERICVVPCTQQLRWEKFLCCRSSCVELLAIISVAGHEL